MTFTRTFAIAIAAISLLAASELNAQQSYSKSWSNNSSWSSSQQWGPNGVRQSGTQTSSNNSTERLTNGGRTQTITQNHNQRNGFNRGFNQNGVMTHNSQYNHRNGQVRQTDHRVAYDRYGNRMVTNDQLTNRYNSQQGVTQVLGRHGYNTASYNNFGRSSTLTNQAQLRNPWGQVQNMGQTQTLGFQNNTTTNVIRGVNGIPTVSRNQIINQIDNGRIWRN